MSTRVFTGTPAAARAALAGVGRRDAVDDDVTAVTRHARALWSGLTEPGDGVAGALIATLGAARALEVGLGAAVTDGELVAADLEPWQLADARRRWAPRITDAPLALEGARRTGVRLVTPDDLEWPARLDDLGIHAPHCLWVRGDPRRLQTSSPSIALVGARAASSYGESVAAEFSAELAATGIAVVSGAAYGIDAAAHRAALAAGGLTQAVLAGGADRAYPAGNARLIDEIAARGVVVSEVPCGSSPTKWRFLQRNRLIAALSDAVVVVEAGWRSGALNTAGHAAQLGRPLGAVPGPVTSGSSAGCHRILREFDSRCVTTADEVRELVGFDVPMGLAAGGRSADATRVLDALSSRAPRRADDIARRSGMAVEEVAIQLGLLALEGAATRAGDGWTRATIA